VLTLLLPAPGGRAIDREDFTKALAELGGNRDAASSEASYEVWAGSLGEAPSLYRSSAHPFREYVLIGGEPFTIRMDSWLPEDTFRRGGFAHVLHGREHALIAERGISLVWLQRDGSPATYYGAGLYTRKRVSGSSLPLPTSRGIGRLGSMRTLLTAVALCLLVFSTSHEAQTPDALARALQKRYQGIAGLLCGLRPGLSRGVLKTQSREEGKVSVKKPGRMRWTYVKPERKEFVSDGTKVYSYIPLDQRVIVSPVSPANEATTPALFLAGNGDIVRDFTSAAAEPAVPGTVAVKLTPRKNDPEFEYLVVSMDPKTLQIRALSTLDRQGVSPL
jgi:outer membrane lipoprotein carrier protein